MSGRPLDVLEAAVGDDVVVRLKSGETYRGILAGYDQHMNLVLDDVVASSEEAETGATSEGNAGMEFDADTGDEADVDAGDEADDGVPADGRDTTIIRGDNVISITP